MTTKTFSIIAALVTTVVVTACMIVIIAASAGSGASTTSEVAVPTRVYSAPGPERGASAAPEGSTRTEADQIEAGDSRWITDPGYTNPRPVRRDEKNYQDPIGPVVVIGPGTPVVQAGWGKCTIGFAGQLGDGSDYAITAGHCAGSNGQPVTTEAEGIVIGRYRAWQSEGDKFDSDASGFAFIELLPNVRISSETAHGPVLGAAVAAPGDEVCKIGATTGLQCGEVMHASDDSIIMDVASQHGDSGGPVVRYRDDGGLDLVGTANGTVEYADGTVMAVANPITNMIADLRDHVDPAPRIYVR